MPNVGGNCKKMRLQRLFNIKTIDKEITKNPGVIFNSKIFTTELLVHGLKIGDSADLIPIEEILTTTFEKSPEGVTRFIYKDNKVFYNVQDKTIEYLLCDRINSVLKYGGILHMKTGAKYVVKDNSIVGIGIHNDIVSPYRKMTKKEIERKFGKAEKIKETFEEVDGTLFHTEYYLNNRQMRIMYDDWDKEISFINIGRFYDE
jgi:hypothetical protein